MLRKFLIVLVALTFVGCAISGFAADAAPGAPVPAAEGGHGAGDSSPGIFTIIMASGFWGVMIWIALFGNFIALFYFVADNAVIIRSVRIMPPALVTSVTQAMEEGDVLKAMKCCESEPGPLANVLTAGFSNVEQGFETIQDMVSAAAEMESEKLMARVTYLNVVSNIGPLLGLLGTVHGMIAAFMSLGVMESGAKKDSMLAINIAESLYCTAAGLLSAIPSLAAYYYFKNSATRLILGMEALTLDLIKTLRNVEVVEE